MAMTLGKDVSALFPDVLKNIATSDLDQKKLVYLYLMYVSLWLNPTTVLTLQELCEISPRPLHSSRQHFCTRFGRPKSSHPRAGH